MGEPVALRRECRAPRKVAVIGGGTGSFNLLKGLVAYDDLAVSSIVTMMDSGGDSGKLRDAFGVLPPGDVRRCLVALSEENQLLRELFSFRFAEEPLEGRSFGNLFLLALTQILGSEKEAIEALGRILKVKGKVIAVTWDHVHLYAELEDGKTVAGEANIDVPKHDPSLRIQRVYLEPQARANPEAVAAIEGSDFIVLAPGDLYTSTIANLLVGGIPEAIRAAGAPLVYVLNLMTKYGETNGYAASHHVAQIARYAGRVPTAMLVHEGKIPEPLLMRYMAEKTHRVRLDAPRLLDMGVRLIEPRDIMSSTSFVRHDPERTARALVDLFARLESRPQGGAAP